MRLSSLEAFSIAHVRGWQGDHYAEVSAEADPERPDLIHLYVDDPTRPTQPAAVVVDLSVDAALNLVGALTQAITEQRDREEVETDE